MLSRRLFLSMAAAALGPQGVDRVEMIVRSARPEDLEMPLEGFANLITPIPHFFVRSHMSVPKVELASWRLNVDGHVETPLTLSMEELRRMPSTELIGVLECAGNGRSFYEPPVAGLQWTNGAVGNGRWRGVRLKDVLNRAGVMAGAVEVLFDGADAPIGAMADFQRAVPIKKALDNAILAYEMNGETLPVKHGFPLRAVVPGWAGNSWVKWIQGIRVLSEEANVFWMKSAYLHPGKPVTPGSAVPAEAMKPVTSLRVKSVIVSPANGMNLDVGKPYIVRGAAWTGDAGQITAVDVSVDRGRNWRAARLTSAATPFGWRLWEYAWTPASEARYTILSRARDSSGDVQPVLQEWNPSGYLWNVTGRVDVDAGRPPSVSTVASEDTSRIPALPLFRDRCRVCHDDDVVRQQRLTRAQWDREINKMVGWGARVQPEERETLLEYLLKIAGPGR